MLTLQKIQHVEKSETTFNIGLNNHKKDGNGLPANKHFTLLGYNFHINTSFILLQQLKKAQQKVLKHWRNTKTTIKKLE